METKMKQALSLITLAIEDLSRSLVFYRDGLGWKPAFTTDEIAFFQLNGFVFSLFTKSGLAEDFGGEIKMGGKSIALAHNVKTRDDVDDILNEIGTIDGSTIVGSPVERSWGGYSGYFEDPDGHIWEVGWNPHWVISDDGHVSMS